MKTLITYYSYSGITAKVVNIFKEILEKMDRFSIKAVDGSNSSQVV